ncbi:MAG TPA: 30S ribosomal protein S9 [Euryarchaeota archaeon]|nr:30S ribosomal protein S9 [Euryarchaeota archaeon]
MMVLIQKSGKRKTSIAKATLKEGKGKIRINSIPVELYQPELARMKIMEVLELAGDSRYQVDINLKVSGGGFMGQAEAAKTAIGRALVEYNTKLKEIFMSYDKTILKGDSRRVETKKYGGPGARAKVQKSYR